MGHHQTTLLCPSQSVVLQTSAKLCYNHNCNMNPANLQLVTFVRDKIGSDEEPLTKFGALTIVRQVLHQNGGHLRGISKKNFLLQAKEVFVNMKSGSKPYCGICFKTFQSRQDRARHVKGVHKENEDARFQCSHCSQSFLSQTSLNYHKDTTHAKQKLRPKCEKCDKSFAHEQTLKRHIKTIHGWPSLYKCDECTVTFHRKDNLTKHERAVHDLHNMAFEEVEKELKQGDGNLKCKMCGEEFKGPKAASRMKYHLGQNCKRYIGYQCDHCWKNFAHKYDLDVHIKIKHTASVPTFQCDFCDFKSVYKNSLNRHTRTTHKEGKTSFELQRKRFASPKYSESN